MENSIALQQPTRAANSNAEYSHSGGWPAYEFGDGNNGTTGIARTRSGASSVKLYSKATSDTPNRFASEFQDAFNEFQQDSLSIVDPDDVAKTGQEITSTLPVLGLPHFDQAARILQFYLSKSLRGNTTIEFQTSVKALGLSPGDIIAITYLKEGLDRTLFRITRIQPGTNYRTATITAQLHEDSWYYDTNGQSNADVSRRQGAFSLGLPRPLSGLTLNQDGELEFAVVESSTQSADGAATVTAFVSFASPRTAVHTAPDIPLVSLTAIVSESGGSLMGGRDLYYAIASLDADGSESSLSFIVHAAIPPGETSAVKLSGLAFPPSAIAFQVYRGFNPSNLSLIASAVVISDSFLDEGLASTAVLPPDPNFDHANFYWRLELQPPVPATIFSRKSIGSVVLELTPRKYVGTAVRIVSGTGAGQERTISENTETELTTMTAWDIEPDSTSVFAIAQGNFQFGATALTSPAQFTIPNEAGAVLQISGRSANWNGVEAPYEISPLTRWTIGGAGIQNVDSAPPPAPTFGVSIPDDLGGTLVLGSVAFPDLSNVSTVTAGTYTVHYLDELNLTPSFTLGESIEADATQIIVYPALGRLNPDHALVDSEILDITSVSEDGTQLTVSRGAQGSSATLHSSGTPVYALSQQVFVVPFAKRFFGTPASGDWSHSVPLPNVRVVSVEMTVTNSQGESPASTINFSSLATGGLRTLSGGQFSFQVPGFLAVQGGAAPDIVVDAPKAVRDVYAVVKMPPSGSDLVMALSLNGGLYCSLIIPDGATTVGLPVDGTTLPPIRYQDRLSIDIQSVGSTVPGSDLTVTVRV